MITKEEALKVLKRQRTKEQAKVRDIANKAIERISNEIRRGRFTIPNIGKDPKVQELISKAFEQEGFIIEYTKSSSSITGKRSRKTTQFDVFNAKVTISD